MTMKTKRIISLLFTVMFSAAILLCACGRETVKTNVDNDNDISHVRIGCFNSGEYFYYRDELDAIARHLQKIGWISGYDEGKTRQTTEEVWQDLSKCSSEYLEFVPEVYYEKYYMSDEELEEATNCDKVDLMLSIGSLSGTFLTSVSDRINYDYMVMAVVDPISAGIIAGTDERYNDRSFAVVDTGRITRQLESAYEIFQFKDVGVVYEDTEEAYSYSGIGQLEEMSEKYGFNIHRMHVKEAYENDYDRYYSELRAAYSELIPEIDMLYITTATIEDDKLPWLLEDVIDAGIVTVAETSESQVENGALMHITMSDATEEGQFIVSKICDYARGVPIKEMDMVFEVAPKICLNSTTIKRTGARLPLATYLIADKIYE
ncbi:MAG: hypothetical protein IJI23_06130 [Lachnospiraceae bacterium]|nr:hypothetical protein [Lachnospiraceae bacterium]